MFWLARLAATILLLYVLAAFLLWVFQRNLLYHPTALLPDNATITRLGFEKIGVEAPDIGVMTAYWKAPFDARQPVYLHLHGNAGNIGTRLPIYQQLSADGAGIIGVGYPGYGGNPGSPDEQGFYAAAQAHYRWLLARGIPAGRIIIYGESMGTGPAVWLAQRFDVAGLMLDAPYSALSELAAQKMPLFPVRWLIADRYPSIARIAHINAPLLWVHGKQDDLIPFAMGQRLFYAASQPKYALSLSNAGHNDIWLQPIGNNVRAYGLEFVAMVSREDHCQSAGGDL